MLFWLQTVDDADCKAGLDNKHNAEKKHDIVKNADSVEALVLRQDGSQEQREESSEQNAR